MRALVRARLPPPVERRATATWNVLRARYRLARADVVLVSYPKAGRTWLASMIGHVLRARYALRDVAANEIESMRDIDRRVPRIFRTHEDVRFGMSPAELERDKRRYARHDVILLVRDPRDIVVSHHHHHRHRMRATAGDLDAFVLSPAGIANVIAFHQHWRDGLHAPRRVLVVRYEALHEDAARELRRVMAFLGVDGITEAMIDAAVTASGFEVMQAIERSGTSPTWALRSLDPANVDALKVRRGRVGGYRDALEASTVAALDEAVRVAGLEVFGYA